MKTKYMEVDDEQFQKYLKKIHSMIHWLLIYKESDNPILDDYFELVQTRILGLSSLLNNPPEIIELAVLIECAQNEYKKGEDCNNKNYRHTVLDAHSVVDSICNKKEE